MTGKTVGTGVPAAITVGLAVATRIVGGLLPVVVGAAVGNLLGVTGASDSAAGQSPLCGGSKPV